MKNLFKQFHLRFVLLGVLVAGIASGCAINPQAGAPVQPSSSYSGSGSPVVTSQPASTPKPVITQKSVSRPSPAPAAPVKTYAPPPVKTYAPPPDPTTPAGCHPLSNEGTCYEPGEYCRNSDHGVSGVAGNGEHITCEYKNGWRWEPS